MRRARLAVVVAITLVTFAALSVPIQSVHAQHQLAHKKSWVQRHPSLTSVGAGIATHHMLKASARRKKAMGKKLNWAERHPTLTSVGVGAATHHVIKKSTHH